MYNGKNYMAPGGDEWIIGGKLTVAEGGAIDGMPAATTTKVGGVKQAAAVADSTATSVADLKTNFNGLLAALRTAGILAPNSET